VLILSVLEHGLQIVAIFLRLLSDRVEAILENFITGDYSQVSWGLDTFHNLLVFLLVIVAILRELLLHRFAICVVDSE